MLLSLNSLISFFTNPHTIPPPPTIYGPMAPRALLTSTIPFNSNNMRNKGSPPRLPCSGHACAGSWSLAVCAELHTRGHASHTRRGMRVTCAGACESHAQGHASHTRKGMQFKVHSRSC